MSYFLFFRFSIAINNEFAGDFWNSFKTRIVYKFLPTLLTSTKILHRLNHCVEKCVEDLVEDCAEDYDKDCNKDCAEDCEEDSFKDCDEDYLVDSFKYVMTGWDEGELLSSSQ